MARSWGTACVSGGGHIAITHGVIVRVLWRAGAEQEGEEEEGHYWTSSSQCVDWRIAEGLAVGEEEEFEQ